MDKSYKLGDIWIAMQNSDSLIMQIAGYIEEMLNTSAIFMFLWFFFFMLLVPFSVSRLFKYKRNVVYVVIFIISFFTMQEIEDYMSFKVNQQFDLMNKLSIKGE